MTDNVNSSKHYRLFDGIEVYDVRMKLLERAGNISPQQADDWSRAWEYLTRMFMKNGLEDAKKARWYLNKLIDEMEFVHAGGDESEWNPANTMPILNHVVEIKIDNVALTCTRTGFNSDGQSLYMDCTTGEEYMGCYKWRYVPKLNDGD